MRGVVLRYLTDVYQALRQVVPPERHTDELTEIMQWLGAAVRGVDSSLLAEWEALHADDTADAAATLARARAGTQEESTAEARFGGEDASVTANRHAFATRVRTAMFQRVELLAREDYEGLAALSQRVGQPEWDAERWRSEIAGYWEEYPDIGIGPDARSRAMSQVHTDGRTWQVVQVLDDTDGDRDWRMQATVDLDASDAAEAPVIHMDRIGTTQEALYSSSHE